MTRAMSGFARTNTVTKVDQDTAGASTTTHAKIGTADNARRWRLRRILASYAATPTQNGTVTITGLVGQDGTTPITITHDFQGRLDLNFGEAGLQCGPWTDVVVTMTAGAATVVSNLTTIAFPE